LKSCHCKRAGALWRQRSQSGDAPSFRVKKLKKRLTNMEEGEARTRRPRPETFFVRPANFSTGSCAASCTAGQQGVKEAGSLVSLRKRSTKRFTWQRKKKFVRRCGEEKRKMQDYPRCESDFVSRFDARSWKLKGKVKSAVVRGKNGIRVVRR